MSGRAFVFWIGEFLVIVRDLLLIIVLTAMIFGTSANTAKAEAPEIYALITFSHTSDIFKGFPFNDKTEPTTNYLGGGATLVWKKLEMDLSLGTKARDCNYIRNDIPRGDCTWVNGANLTLRWYPWRKR